MTFPGESGQMSKGSGQTQKQQDIDILVQGNTFKGRGMENHSVIRNFTLCLVGERGYVGEGRN